MKTPIATLAATLTLAASGFSQQQDLGLAARPGQAERPGQISSQSSVATTTSMDNLDVTRELLIGDVLSFRIIEDEEPVTRIVITDSGEVDVPYIGLVSAKGKTCKAIAVEIKKQLEKDYYHKATVIVGLSYNLYGSRSIATAARGTSTHPANNHRTQLRAKDGFTVMGMIAGPGIYEIAEDSGDEFLLSHAVLRAGGLKPFANDKKVRVIRRSGEGKVSIIVNLRDVMKNGKLEKDVPIRRGDVIIIDRRTFNF
jgi:polysaccharide export outer membrane protein